MLIRKLKEGEIINRKDTINLELGMVKLKKDKFNKLGLHPDEEEAYIILSGQAILLLGEEKKKVSKGDVIYVPANVRHQFTSLTDDFEYVYAATWPEELKGRKQKY